MALTSLHRFPQIKSNRVVSTTAAFVIMLLSLLLSAPLAANELSFLINAKAFEAEQTFDQDSNQENSDASRDFGLQYEFAEHGEKWVPFLAASGFIGSNRYKSFYAGGGFMRRLMISQHLNYLHADAGLVGFVMTRKDYKNGDPFLGLLPTLSLGSREVSVNVTYIPQVEKGTEEQWFLQLKISTDDLI